MNGNQFSNPSVRAFVQEFPTILQPARNEFYRQQSEEKLGGRLQEFLVNFEELFRRELGRLQHESATAFAQEHAAKMANLYLRYRQDSRSGAVRLSFEHYIRNILIPEFRKKEAARVS